MKLKRIAKRLAKPDKKPSGVDDALAEAGFSVDQITMLKSGLTIEQVLTTERKKDKKAKKDK